MLFFLTNEGVWKWISSKCPLSLLPKNGSVRKQHFKKQICLTASYALNYCSPLVVRIMGLLVLLMKVLIAARNPTSSGKMTSTWVDIFKIGSTLKKKCEQYSYSNQQIELVINQINDLLINN